MKYEKYLKIIDKYSEEFCAVSDAIWDFAELSFDEYDSAKTLIKSLENHGFSIKKGVAGIPTAFCATFGKGKPHIGILAEYDALSGLSQKADVTHKQEREGVKTGHGCGHNLFAGGSLAAAVAVSEYIKETGRGSVTLFGCPGEESGAGKVYMARDGVFSDIDAVVSWHPECMYMVRTRPSLANASLIFRFEGVASHAGRAYMGRSALDAVELMNVGVQFLREHIEPTSRVHYAILDNGGDAPNIVQSHASVRYMMRAVDAFAVRDLVARVINIAKGAALMTDATMEYEQVAGMSELIMNSVLQGVANEALHDIPLPKPTAEDIKIANELRKTMKIPEGDENSPVYPEKALEPAPPVAHGGSTDTSDVSWNAPTVQMHIGTWCRNTVGHSWQSTVQARGHYAKQAMLFAGKAVAQTAIRLMEDEDLLKSAKAEFAQKTKSGYVPPIPPELKPVCAPKRADL